MASLVHSESQQSREQSTERARFGKQTTLYSPTKHDEIDAQFAETLNKESNSNIVENLEITRVSKGVYMFGTLKIHAELRNGHLIIRVGGGYMSMDEFIQHHGAAEINKLNE